MINICFLSGKVLNKIDLQFVYGSKKITSVVEIELILDDGQVIKVYGYDDMADFIYRNVGQNDIIWIEGRIRNNDIEIFMFLLV